MDDFFGIVSILAIPMGGDDDSLRRKKDIVKV